MLDMNWDPTLVSPTMAPNDMSLSSPQSLIVVDDCPIVRYRWAKGEDLPPVTLFASPDDLLAAIAEDPNVLQDCLAVVTDFYFEANASLDGIGLAERLRSLGFGKPIFLASDGEFADRDLSGITARVAKDPAEAMAVIERHLAFW